MDKKIIDFITNHVDSIDANEFEFIFAVTRTVGISSADLMRLFLEAELEPLRYMHRLPNHIFDGQYINKPLIIPGNIEIVGMDAFTDFQGSEIIFEEGLEEIEAVAFKDADYLERVVLPKTLAKIGSWIFLHCFNLKEIVYNGTKEQFKAINKPNNNCFAPLFSYNDYKFIVKCTDGDLTLKEAQA